MDNLSHSFAGLAAGELIHRCLPSEAAPECQSLRRKCLLVTCLLASNFPDLDLLWSDLLPPPLGYLLHHRGHTHTLLYALPQALLLAGLLWLAWPAARRLLAGSSSARAGFALSLIAGLLLHIMMDYLNSYGIHPFHPFDNSWYFGDMVFIIEPFFWVAFGIPVMITVRWRWLQGLLIAALAGVILYFTVQGYLAWYSFAALLAVGALLGTMQHRSGTQGKTGLLLALVAGLMFVGMQNLASAHARRLVSATLQQMDSGSVLLDAAMTSFPSNPLCWTFASVERSADRFRVRRGMASIAPDLLPVGQCPGRLADSSLESVPGTSLVTTFRSEGGVEMLRLLAQQNCHFNAWLRFARIPAMDGDRATDARFQTPHRNFTTIDLRQLEHLECPAHVPQWDFPRADLLQR